MKLDVKSIDYNVHNYEEENFDDFDEIYDSIMMNSIDEVEGNDIIELCKVFCVPFEEIHPHQYIKIYKIMFWIVNRIGIEQGFEMLLKGLELIEERYIKDIINMLLNSYTDEQIEYFKALLSSYDLGLQEKILKYFV